MINKTRQGNFRVRVKSKGRVVADRTFRTRKEAAAWERTQRYRLDHEEFVDPAMGRTPLRDVYVPWMSIRESQKASRTTDSDRGAWNNHLAARFGNVPIGRITRADVEAFAADLRTTLAAGTVNRILATLSALLGYGVDARYVRLNVALGVRVVEANADPDDEETEDMHLKTRVELVSLVAEQAAHSKYADVTMFLALTGLRWGELAGLQPRDHRYGPTGRPRILVQRVITYSNGGGKASVKPYPKSKRRRVVPLPPEAEAIFKRWAAGKKPGDGVFAAPEGGLLYNSNFRRSVQWAETAGTFRLHDLRHTYASWLIAAGADVKTIQTILGHASARTTLDTYGHLMSSDQLDAAAERLAGYLGDESGTTEDDSDGSPGLSEAS